MAAIKIEGGCYKVVNTWHYPQYTTEGFKNITFTTVGDEVPEIGDFIENGKLRKREGYQVNNEGRLKWPGSEEYQDPYSWQRITLP